MTKHFFCFSICLLILTGCYHFGAPGNAHFSLNELKVQNATREPSLGRYVSASIREHIGTDPSSSLKAKADYTKYDIFVNVTDCINKNRASAKLRNHKSLDSKSDSYQTVLFGVTLKAKVTVKEPGSDKPVLERNYTGTGDFPLMHDHDVPFQSACKQAANNIALQLVDDLATLKP